MVTTASEPGATQRALLSALQEVPDRARRRQLAYCAATMLLHVRMVCVNGVLGWHEADLALACWLLNEPGTEDSK
jgi:hypothetical protein